MRNGPFGMSKRLRRAAGSAVGVRARTGLPLARQLLRRDAGLGRQQFQRFHLIHSDKPGQTPALILRFHALNDNTSCERLSIGKIAGSSE